MKVFAFAVIAVVCFSFVATEDDKAKLKQDDKLKDLFKTDDKTKTPVQNDGDKSKTPTQNDENKAKTSFQKDEGQSKETKTEKKSKIMMERNDEFTRTIEKCLDNLGLADKEELTDEDNYCLFGCLLNQFNLIDEDGKLMENGVENFMESVPAQYLADYPNMAKDLTAILPELQKSSDTCESGKAASKVVGDLFSTEFY